MQFIKCLGKRAAFLIAACAILTACIDDPIETVRPKDSGERSLTAASTAAVAHPLKAGDRVRVTVFDLTAETSEHTVDETGALTIPPIGPIPVGGMVAKEAALLITNSYVKAGLYRNARVTVDVLSYGHFYVLGEVTKPGEFEFRPGMSLFAAVATAGGYTYRANTGRVFIRRENETLETAYELKADVAIMPGDVIRVPEIRL
jgi:protein involved in polysaccharide export with SLBB domain